VSDLAPVLQSFFTVKLLQQKKASPHTVASYRDTWRLLLTYAQQATATPPSRMRIAQLDHVLITGFLQHLEHGRGNSARTRNARLAAIHSLFRYAELHAPDDADVIRRVLAIDTARFRTTEIAWLTGAETAAILSACDRRTWTGLRDFTMITTLIATGLRISELLSLTRSDVRVQHAGAHIRCTGKGRRERCTPLDPAAAAAIKLWLDASPGPPSSPLFPARGRNPHALTRDGFQARLTRYQQIAIPACPSLADKKITPHVLRHTRAMNMRAAGHDISIIALWLGHQDISSTQKYLHADLHAKEQTLDRTTPDDTLPGRYQPSDAVLAFLDNLTAQAPEQELSRRHHADPPSAPAS
jgi:site-specific recombinase XerD